MASDGGVLVIFMHCFLVPADCVFASVDDDAIVAVGTGSEEARSSEAEDCDAAASVCWTN